jgi:hypothetical protein
MARLYIGLLYTKAQIPTNTPTVGSTGNSRSAVKATISTSVDDATHSRAVILSNLFMGRQVVRRNPAGT